MKYDGDAVENRVARAFDIVVLDFPHHDARVTILFDPTAFDCGRMRVFEGDVAVFCYAVGLDGNAIKMEFPGSVRDNILVRDLLRGSLGEVGAGACGSLKFKAERGYAEDHLFCRDAALFPVVARFFP